MSVTTNPPAPPTPPAPPVPPVPSAETAPTPPPARPAGAATALRIGAVITGLLIIVGAINLFALTAGQVTTSSHRTFDPVGSSLLVHSDSADVTLVPSDAAGIEVDQTIHAAHGRTVGEPTIDGSRLELPSSCGGGTGWLFLCSVDYVVHVPSTLQLQVRTGAGDVRADGIESASLSIDVGSGDVSLAGPQVSRLALSSGSGDVHVSGLVTSVASVDVGSGDVRLGFAQAPQLSVDAKTGSGDLTITVPRDDTVYVLSTRSGSGDLNNQLRSQASPTPGGAAAPFIRAATGSGDLTLKYAG